MDIRCLDIADDSCQIQLMAWGHHPVEEFARECERFLSDYDERVETIDPSLVKQTYWTTRPPEEHETLADDYVFTETVKGKGRAVTVLTEVLPN
ncbi:hypothetical protein [Pseudoalteromonas rubra]|uniref:hypothetical protein n=1 Tax=Pseudoalteromonas rubra TaxID=43658 RepID=UPI000F77DC25|nr:hypothetical protein [Pseudoalteromonas rubra]